MSSYHSNDLSLKSIWRGAPKDKWKIVSNNMQTVLECLFDTMFTPYKYQHVLSQRVKTLTTTMYEFLSGIVEDIGSTKYSKYYLWVQRYPMLNNLLVPLCVHGRHFPYCMRLKIFPFVDSEPLLDLFNQLDAIADTRNKVGGHFATKEVFEQEICRNIQTQVNTIPL